MSTRRAGIMARAVASIGDRANGADSFHIFLVMVGMQGLLGRLIGYFVPLYFKEIGISGVQTGLYFSVSSVALIVLSLPMGITTDQKSISRILMLSFALVGFGYVGFLFFESFAAFCAFAFVGGFGKRFYTTASNTLFYKLTGTDNSRQAGLFQLFQFLFTGTGMILGGLIIARFSYRGVFLVACVGNLVLAGLAHFLPRTETVSIKLAEYRKSVFTPRVLFFAVVFSLSSLHWGAEMVSYSPFLKDVLDLSIVETGLFVGSGFFFVGIGAYLGHVMLERGWVKDLQTILKIGFVLAGVFHVLMTVPVIRVSYSMRLFHEIGDGLVFFVFYHGITKVFKIDRIGGCAAFISLAMGLSSMGGSVLFGYIRDQFGAQWPLILSGLVMTSIPMLLSLAPSPVVRGEESAETVRR